VCSDQLPSSVWIPFKLNMPLILFLLVLCVCHCVCVVFSIFPLYSSDHEGKKGWFCSLFSSHCSWDQNRHLECCCIQWKYCTVPCWCNVAGFTAFVLLQCHHRGVLTSHVMDSQQDAGQSGLASSARHFSASFIIVVTFVLYRYMFISFHTRGSQTYWLIQTQHCECEQLLWESQVTFIYRSRTYWCRLWHTHKIFSWPHLPHTTDKSDRCIDVVCCFRSGIDTRRLSIQGRLILL